MNCSTFGKWLRFYVPRINGVVVAGPRLVRPIHMQRAASTDNKQIPNRPPTCLTSAVTGMLSLSLACLTAVPLSYAADLTVADGAVAAVLRSAAPALPNATIVRRMAVDNQLDLVLALASRQPQRAGFDGRYSWSPQDRLGLFLQARSDPNRVSQLAIEVGPNDDCATRIERMTTQELVLSCVGEKSATYDNRRFVYDIHAKALVSYSSYPPYWTAQVLRDAGGPHFVMANNQQLALVDIDRTTGALRVAPAAEASRVLAQIPMVESTVGDQTFHAPAPAPDSVAGFGPGGRFRLSKAKNQYGSEYTLIVEAPGPNQKPYPLVQSDLRTWLQARPDDASTPARPNPAEMNEEIGPHQLEGARLWFGKTFYNSEGSTGVGGFGYFDAATASYRLYSPPEIQRWSVSAILVEADYIWLALYRRGEFGNSSGGLLRWDRKSSQARSFAVPDIATFIVRAGDFIYLGATDGIVALHGDRTTSYFVDRSSTGYAMAERTGVPIQVAPPAH
jgi:hypothetical protein